MNPAIRTMTADHQGASRAAHAIGSQWAELFDGVDDLIHRVADAENPEILRRRAKVYATMIAARNALEERAKAPPARVAPTGDSPERRVVDDPAETLGVNLLLGLGLGLIASLVA
jgi:ElaB/YqjD/DUF883 family membrane-anchored ribosome-binding protein